jgi:TRAP-type C4-dicarboxylate transport system permease small subunit
MHPIQRIARVLTAVEAAASTIAAIVLFAIMAIVATDVAMRYAFNRPFGWSYDLVSLYLVLVIFYFCLSRAFATHTHVGIDILHYFLSPPARRLCALATCVVAAPVFALITAVCAERAWAAWSAGDVSAGAIAWPSWAYLALAPLGAGLLTLRLVVDALAHLTTLLGGPEIIPLPPLARSDAALDQAAFE